MNSHDARGLVALAAALAPARAAALLGRHPGVDPDRIRALLAAPRADRLAALASALRPPEREADGPGTRGARDGAEGAPAWPVLEPGDVLPFDLPPVAPALALLDASLLDLGERAARAAARGLSSVLGGEASLHGRILPGLPNPAGAALVHRADGPGRGRLPRRGPRLRGPAGRARGGRDRALRGFRVARGGGARGGGTRRPGRARRTRRRDGD